MNRIGYAFPPSPADPAPSLYDDSTRVLDVLCDAGIPDYLADALTEVAMAGWTPDSWAAALEYVKRQVQPILDEAERKAA